jgi:hypothetical protein
MVSPLPPVPSDDETLVLPESGSMPLVRRWRLSRELGPLVRSAPGLEALEREALLLRRPEVVSLPEGAPRFLLSAACSIASWLQEEQRSLGGSCEGAGREKRRRMVRLGDVQRVDSSATTAAPTHPTAMTTVTARSCRSRNSPFLNNIRLEREGTHDTM